MIPAASGTTTPPSSSVPALTPVIAGPTAGGKSDLAVDLALAAQARLGIEAEVIAADAFQIYRGMDIGTAKPTYAGRRGVPHHLVDLIDPHDPAARFTVDDWLTHATAALAEVRARGRWPIVVGGTHLYIKALLDGLFDGPEPDPALRAELTAMDPAARRAELERIDPAAATRIHPNDVRRTVRAIEVHRLTGRPISEHQRQWDRPDAARDAEARHRLILLDWEPEALARRINARVKAMMDRGLLDEIRTLLRDGPIGAQPAEALGYKQLLRLAAAPSPPAAELEAAVEQIKIETRRFAKNQRTWIRRLRTTPGCITITCPPVPGPVEAAKLLMQFAP